MSSHLCLSAAAGRESSEILRTNKKVAASLSFLSVLMAAAVAGFAFESPAHAAEPSSWVERSDQNAQLLLELVARFAPEAAGQIGVDGYDEEVSRLPLDLNRQNEEAVEGALEILRKRQAQETHPAILQDLGILIEEGESDIADTRLDEKHMLPYFDLHQRIFRGIRALLDDQVEPERRPAALVRLRKYAGLVEGYVPLAEQAEAYIRARFDQPGLIGPYRAEVEKNLANAPRFVGGITELFEKYEIDGYEEAHAALAEQLAGYEDFVRKEVLARARDDHRLPPEIYAMNLRNFGVDMPVDELVSRAKVAFREIQNEMQSLAGLLAVEHEGEFESNDYRDVIRKLKEDQLVGEAILPHYQSRIKELERLIEKHDVLSLPERPMRIRLASEAESAATPAPNMRPPRLIGNTGEQGEFVLPLKIPSDSGEEEVDFDDFTFDAASWTLTVHEGRPGHELQFASIVEKGVSRTRVLFAFNSVNVEGWALYSEAEMKPYMPLDGQLVSLQHRLLRAARAFLDPSLQLGEVTPEEVKRVLMEDVVLSEAAAQQEVERYTARAPGQATSYFCGYTRLMELRTEVERRLGKKFDRRAYHDFILAQGLLPPALLKKTVLEDFVGPQVTAVSTDQG